MSDDDQLAINPAVGLLVIGALYKNAAGENIFIEELIDPADHKDAPWYKKGYRFRDQFGDSYLPNGKFDHDEPESIMNLVIVKIQDYLTQHTDGFVSVVRSADPKTALAEAQTRFGFSGEPAAADKIRIYRLIDVTPSDTGGSDAKTD